MGTLLKVGLFGGAAYLAYEYFFAAPASPATSSASPATTTAPSSAVPPVVGANSLDALATKLFAAANAPADGLTVDQWNWFLMQVKPGFTAPDPMPIFMAAIPNFDRSQKITGVQYWLYMAPYLRANLGMSGMGMLWNLAQMAAL